MSLSYIFRVISIFEWFLPDIVMLISTPSIYLMLRKLTATDTPDIESAGTTVQTESSQQISNENLIILKKIGKLFDGSGHQLHIIHCEEIFNLTSVF